MDKMYEIWPRVLDRLFPEPWVYDSDLPEGHFDGGMHSSRLLDRNLSYEKMQRLRYTMFCCLMDLVMSYSKELDALKKKEMEVRMLELLIKFIKSKQCAKKYLNDLLVNSICQQCPLEIVARLYVAKATTISYGFDGKENVDLLPPFKVIWQPACVDRFLDYAYHENVARNILESHRSWYDGVVQSNYIDTLEKSGKGESPYSVHIKREKMLNGEKTCVFYS
jgi:hypothetical protein